MSEIKVLVVDDEPLHVYMGHLRNKLEHDSARPRFLLTEPGVGYRLKAD
jgi:two-component system KDP operon response regulator KdpE